MSLRDLIIELDKEIGRFVQEPMFANIKLVEAKSSEEAQKVLERVIFLADALSKAAPENR